MSLRDSHPVGRADWPVPARPPTSEDRPVGKLETVPHFTRSGIQSRLGRTGNLASVLPTFLQMFLPVSHTAGPDNQGFWGDIGLARDVFQG